MAKQNSNMVITGYKVDPTTQQITSLEVNGETVETGGEPELQNKSVAISSMEQFDSFATGMYVKEVEPSEGYDGMSKANFQVSALLFAPETLYEATLGGTKKILIQNIDIDASGYITAFSGSLYTMYGSSAGVYLSKADYQVAEGPCGGTKTVRVDGVTYTTATKSWS